MVRRRNWADLVRQRFGMLTVVAIEPRITGEPVIARVECDCGNTRSMRADVLARGEATACGCRRGRSHKHGMTHSSEYSIWRCMRKRCYDPGAKGYEGYGGRGVTACDEWRNDFSAFYRDMGPRPSPFYSLDRYPNNNGDYEPGNCRWATRKEQANNTRSVERGKERASLVADLIRKGLEPRVIAREIGISKGHAYALSKLVRQEDRLAMDSGTVRPMMRIVKSGELTEREAEIACISLTGRTTKLIAESLGIANQTVKNHLHAIYVKLRVRNRREMREALVVKEAA